MYHPLIFVHVCGATIGLLSGMLAMVFRKGGSLHAIAGNIFFVSMLTMSSSAIYISTVIHPEPINVIAGSLTFYLVTTAWWTAKRRDASIGAFDIAACAVAFAIGVVTYAKVASTPDHHGMHVVMYIFGTVAMLFGIGDVRMIVRGGVSGARRIARHLVRMCLALLIVTFSTYPGQARLFPMAWRETNLLWVPHVLLVGSLFFWIARMSNRRRVQEARS